MSPGASLTISPTLNPDEYINALFSDFDLKSDEEILADEYTNKDE